MNRSQSDSKGRPNVAVRADAPETLERAEDWLGEHGDALYRFARMRVGRRETAEDLVQETFLAAMSAREPFRGQSSVRTWLVSILRRKIVDHYRKVSAARARGDIDSPGGVDASEWFTAEGAWRNAVASWKTPSRIVEDREFWRVLDGCLARLPRALASAFVLRELEGMDANELQKSLALSAGNVRVRLFRARQLLRACLEKRWFGNEGET